MSSRAVARGFALPRVYEELLRRNGALAAFGLILVPLGLIAVLAQTLDTRSLESGVNVWVKPAKFFFSMSAFALTAAWFFGYVREERREARSMRGVTRVLIATGVFELAYICWQAAQGLESHFNDGTPFHAAMYASMGIAAVLLVGTTLPLAWEIARRPAPGLDRSFSAAVVIGLGLTFVLGGGFGAYMSSQTGHSVGVEGGRLALFGWNGLGGDLRVAHFFGIHAEQAIPLLAMLTADAGVRMRWILLAVASLAYVGFTLFVFALATAGQPLFPA
jgi:hypothetical protein